MKSKQEGGVFMRIPPDILVLRARIEIPSQRFYNTRVDTGFELTELSVAQILA